MVSVGRDVSTFVYYVNGLPIKRNVGSRDIGLQIDFRFTFEIHVKQVKLKCYRLINIAFKLFAIRDQSFYLQFYASYILTMIDFCSSICQCLHQKCKWDWKDSPFLYQETVPPVPSEYCGSEIFVSPQRVWSLLLWKRALRNDLLLLYRIFKFSIIVSGLELPESSFRPNRLVVSRSCCSLQRVLFVHRTVMLWNRHSSKFDFSSRSAFKTSVFALPLSSSLRGSAFKDFWAVRAIQK